MASPADYLYDLRGYCSQGSGLQRRNAWLRLLAAPLPAVVAMTLTDALPLQPPSRGLAYSHLTWVRVWICAAIVTVCSVIKLNRFVPAAAIPSWRAIIRVVVFTATGTTAWVLWLATRIGYPLPFTFNMSQPIFCALLMAITIHTVSWWRLRGQLRTLATMVAVLTIQMTQTAVYPTAQFALSRVHLSILPLLLPVLKYGYKRLFALVMRGDPALRPVVVVFNAEVFHALYVSLTMQVSSSGWTPALFIGIDMLGIAYTLLRIHRRLRSLRKLMPSLGPVLDCSLFLLRDPETSDAFTAETSSLPPPTRSVVASVVAVFPMATRAPKVNKPLFTRSSTSTGERLTPAQRAELRSLALPDKVAFVQQTIELLHATETFILAEYVEVVVPVVYSIYASVISQLPNLAFYPQLRGLSRGAYERTVGSVLAYGALELLSFLPLDWLLRHRLGFHPMQQLTFALRNESVLVASELMLWLVYMVQVSLDHFGNDFTFRFQWLHTHQQP